MLMQSLGHAGYGVTVATNGREGLRSFRTEPADLVITDIVMPDQEGISTIIRLRDESPDTPIIAISGAGANAHYLDLALKLGASRSLAKPFGPEALLAVVHEVLAVTRLERPSRHHVSANNPSGEANGIR